MPRHRFDCKFKAQFDLRGLSLRWSPLLTNHALPLNLGESRRESRVRPRALLLSDQQVHPDMLGLLCVLYPMVDCGSARPNGGWSYPG